MSLDGTENERMKIAAQTSREAAKLYGLYLLHCGLLKPLGRPPCHVQVKNVQNRADCSGQGFKLWNAGEKIYTECFVPSKQVTNKRLQHIKKNILILLDYMYVNNKNQLYK